MGHFFRSFAIINLLLFACVSSADYPGVTPGSFTVTDAGAASYTMPITTPTGVNGMSPELAISYNSSGGNGLMGLGFQLSGFSSGIYRCGGSHATDGKASAVNYDNTDKLCLDGQRLILVQGAPFTQGALYHTEVESFTKIVYQNGNFLAYSKDGERTWYTWRVKASGKTVRWLMSSVQDRTGNKIRYNYQHVDGEYWMPKEVLWTGKGNDVGNRKAEFIYKTRDDKRTTFEYGTKREHKHLIDKVITKINDIRIKEYRFVYATSPVSGLSRLREIRQCGVNGGCFPKHEFQWKDTVKGFNSDNSSYHLPVKIYDYQDQFEVAAQSGDFIDVNNDGLVDYVVSYKDFTTKQARHEIYKNTGTEFELISQKPPTGFVMRDYRIRKKTFSKGCMKM